MQVAWNWFLFRQVGLWETVYGEAQNAGKNDVRTETCCSATFTKTFGNQDLKHKKMGAAFWLHVKAILGS